jgi:NAD+ synthase (glutamine-hydrolysing)
MTKKYDKSLVIGKFYPFHKGHQYLIETACKYSNEVYVVVTHTDLYHIPVETRKSWIEEVFPNVTVKTLTHDPSLDNPSPNKSQIWAQVTVDTLGFKPNAVFCSEDYGTAYSGFMGAVNEVVDKDRVTFPISGTKARKNYFADDVWPLLAGPTQKYFSKFKGAKPFEKIKIAVVQMDVIPGRPDKNFKKMASEIKEAKRRDVDIIVFPEMSVSGYFLGDEWENNAFIDDLIDYNEDLKRLSSGITIIWGNVFADKSKMNEDGRVRKYNAAFIAQNGSWVSNGVFKGRTYKSLMPKYRFFDDERHFYSMIKLADERETNLSELLKPFQIEIRGEKINVGLSLCEDMWQDDYAQKPMDVLVEGGADMLINISSSPWTWKKNYKRNRVVKSLLDKYPIPFIYCNNVGIQNNGKNVLMFDGNSCVYGSDGLIKLEIESYKESTAHFTLFDSSSIKLQRVFDSYNIEELYQSLVYGIKKFFESIHINKVVIGLSGGIDSAVSCSLIVGALGAENVYAVNMPSKYNSALTKNAAADLAKNLDVNYAVVSIQDSVEKTNRQLESLKFEGKRHIKIEVTDLVAQNIQARDRSSRVLAAIASSINGVFVNNGNKTETALGYATLYGDVSGAVAPIADLYKREVYQLAHYINKMYGYNVIPKSIFDTVPSAELSASQDVTKGLGDPIKYDYHDELIRAFVELRYDPENVLRMYINDELEEALNIPKGIIKKHFKSHSIFVSDLEHMWKLFKINYFKRIQAPPILVASRRSFGFDLRESQNSVYFTREYRRLKDSIL